MLYILSVTLQDPFSGRFGFFFKQWSLHLRNGSGLEIREWKVTYPLVQLTSVFCSSAFHLKNAVIYIRQMPLLSADVPCFRNTMVYQILPQITATLMLASNSVYLFPVIKSCHLASAISDPSPLIQESQFHHSISYYQSQPTRNSNK